VKTAHAGNPRPRHRRRSVAAGALAAFILAAPALADTAPATPKNPEDLAPAGRISLFDAKSQASVESFFFHAPTAVFPFKVEGGFLQSTAVATSSPRAFGYAGPAPVPLLTSAGIIIPEAIPGTGVPIPEDLRKGFQSIDYTALPNYCQASFPAARDGGGEAYCGGPAQTQTALGFNSATVNGHVKTTGSFDDPLATKTESESRGQDVFIPALQATYHAAYAAAQTGINGQGLPQASGVAEFQRAQFLGSLVVLEGVRSQTIVATDGTDQGTATRSTLTVGSAYIFGVPVVITTEGVVVAKEAAPNSSPKPLTEALNKQMADAHGLTVRLIPAPPVQRTGSEVIAESGSIEIAYDSQEPTPVRVVHRVAYTRAAVNALVESGSLDVGLPESSSVSSGSSDTGAGSSSTSYDLPSGDISDSDTMSYDNVGYETASASADSASLDTPATGAVAFASGDLGARDLATGFDSPSDAGGTVDQEEELAAVNLTTTGSQPLLSAPQLAAPASATTLPADELTNVYVGFGFLAAAVVILLPLRRAITNLGRK
jgi:hypothetical protein